MSYELKIDKKSRAAGRFIGAVRKSLVSAAIDEKKESGISQQKIATKLGVNRSVINRLLRGDTNLTLRSVAEIAWALGWEPVFTLRRRSAEREKGSNHFEQVDINRQPLRPTVLTSTNSPYLPTGTGTGTTRTNTLEMVD